MPLKQRCATGKSYCVWHLTDTHLDPVYVAGSEAEKCWCITGSACPRLGQSCGMSTNPNEKAGPWGNAEGNCATPLQLYQSALDFMKQTSEPTLVYNTGDYAQAGLSWDCSAASPAKRQINDVVQTNWDMLKKAVPQAKMLGCLGNAPTNQCVVLMATE